MFVLLTAGFVTMTPSFQMVNLQLPIIKITSLKNGDRWMEFTDQQWTLWQ